MKRLLIATLLMMSSSISYAVWTADMTIQQVREDTVVGSSIVASNTGVTVNCYVRGDDADADKTIMATALTAKSTTATVSLSIEWTTDPLGAVAGTQCILRGIALK